MRTSRLGGDKAAILELVAHSPIDSFPKQHVAAIEELVRIGLIIRREERWYPTAKGLMMAGYTLH